MSASRRFPVVAAGLILAATATGAYARQARPAAATAPAAVRALPFVEDNYAKALEDAKRRNVPLFAELWAPW